jgi:pSer/pThr/pTyr-binding forkhead associated (FHA) protein
MFKIQEQGKPETAIWLNKLETFLSTDGQADIALSKTYMQEMVCSVKISSAENDKLFVADLTFNQDISINGAMVAKGSRTELHHGDVITIGQDTFEIFNPSVALKRLSNKDTTVASWQLKGVSNWLDGQSFNIQGKAVLGRDGSCDITIPGSHLSRRHAEIFIVGDSLLIKDLDSANGSFMNGKAFSETKARHGDQLRFDQLNFEVVAPPSVTDQNSLISATYDIPSSQIKDPINNTEQNYLKHNEVHANKQWVTKPTSVGNQVTDADIRLKNHQKQQRMTYLIFGLAISAAIIGTVTWQVIF